MIICYCFFIKNTSICFLLIIFYLNHFLSLLYLFKTTFVTVNLIVIFILISTTANLKTTVIAINPLFLRFYILYSNLNNILEKFYPT